MSTGRYLTVGAAASLVASAAGLCVWFRVPRGEVLVIFNSAQLRWVEVLDCAACDSFDLARGNPREIGGPYAGVVLDGHSLPPASLLGVDPRSVVDVVRRAKPQWVVAATCYGAETQVLDALFDTSPGLDLVIASPDSVPWGGLTLSGGCPGGASAGCVTVPRGFFEYHRSDWAQLHANAHAASQAAIACAGVPDFVRLHPALLCVRSVDGPPLVWALSRDELAGPCYDVPPDLLVSGVCGRPPSARRDPPPEPPGPG